ncbi:MAG: hypothetical protein EZS28_050136, partial [Streblomastix strix]
LACLIVAERPQLPLRSKQEAFYQIRNHPPLSCMEGKLPAVAITALILWEIFQLFASIAILPDTAARSAMIEIYGTTLGNVRLLLIFLNSAKKIMEELLFRKFIPLIPEVGDPEFIYKANSNSRSPTAIDFLRLAGNSDYNENNQNSNNRQLAYTIYYAVSDILPIFAMHPLQPQFMKYSFRYNWNLGRNDYVNLVEAILCISNRNAFGLGNGVGCSVNPSASIMNHSCSPSATFNPKFDQRPYSSKYPPEQPTIIVQLMSTLEPNDELT